MFRSRQCLLSLQCFVTVGCATGRTSRPYKILLQNPLDWRLM